VFYSSQTPLEGVRRLGRLAGRGGGPSHFDLFSEVIVGELDQVNAFFSYGMVNETYCPTIFQRIPLLNETGDAVEQR
jgi:hypothetical protein